MFFTVVKQLYFMTLIEQSILFKYWRFIKDLGRKNNLFFLLIQNPLNICVFSPFLESPLPAYDSGRRQNIRTLQPPKIAFLHIHTYNSI